MFERIIFEIDGTLVNSESAIRSSLAQLIKDEFNETRHPDDLAFYFGIPRIDSLRLLGLSNPEQLNDKWSKILLAHYDEVNLFPGIKEMLETLHDNGIKLGIVTTKSRKDYVNEFHDRFGIDDLFEDHICCEDSLGRKPDPAPVIEYLHRNKGLPEKTLYVANTVHDFNSADRANVTFALALWGCSYEYSGVIQAKHQIPSPEGLLKFLNI